ncbi:hypothetical protein [Wenzhouxiangella sp. EGI_FJ10409]|uniref:hypothetical protein n=1 Tax=Wenzhouxiangella sp. EGI_FJ10409 TaxID=3243767 RepID=UPI0035D92BFA
MRIATIILLCACAAFASHSHADTAFTYQGQLQTVEGPVTDTVDLEFSLYETEDGSNQVGSTISRPGVEVDDGLFRVELDFGAGVFDGSPRYLEISVGGEPLAPRQRVTGVPLAGYALDAPDTLDGLSCAENEVPKWDGASWQCASDEFEPAVWSLVGDGAVFDSGSVGIGVQPSSSNKLYVQDASGSGNGLRVDVDAADYNAVYATNAAETDWSWGVRGDTHSVNSNARGVMGYAHAIDGAGQGVAGQTFGTEVGAAGVYGLASSSTGEVHGVVGETDSPDGYGLYSRDAMRSEGMVEADRGVLYRQRGQPTASELADGEVMVYSSDGTDGFNAGDLVYAVNDGGSILTQALAQRNNATSVPASADAASQAGTVPVPDGASDSGQESRMASLENENARKQARIEALERRLAEQQERLAALEAVLLEDERVARSE